MYPAALSDFNTSTTLPYLVDYHLEHNPDAIFAVFPSSTTSQGCQELSFRQFGRAVHRFAHQVLTRVRPGEVVGLIATADTLLYLAAVVGFIQAGVTVFPISPRNSPAAVVNMLAKVSARRLMVTSSLLQPLITGIQKATFDSAGVRTIEFLELPSFTDIFVDLNADVTEDPVMRVPLPSREVFKGDVAIYVHSSGSTGLPKPIPWTNAFIANLSHSDFYATAFHQESNVVVGSMSLPSFHTMGLLCQLLVPLFSGKPIATFAPQHPRAPVVPSPEATLHALEKTHANIAIVVPAFLEIWAQDEGAVNLLEKMLHVSFAGGPLAPGFGDVLAMRGVRLVAVYGGTEFGVPTVTWPSPSKSLDDWAWMQFEGRSRPRWVDMGDGQYELQLLTSDAFVLAVENLTDVQGYSTKDLWVKHPTKDGLWRIVGRVDDVIIMANGEKTVPGPQEAIISSSPLVQGVVMFGRERNQVGVLIEPSPDHRVDPQDQVALAGFRNALWPSIDRANADAPAFSRIFKEMILVATSNKPLPRASKGTVQRKAALAEYAEEIEAIYNLAENSGKADDISPPTAWTAPEIGDWLTLICTSIQNGSPPDAQVDLFEQGFDSLSATFLRNRIINAMRTSPEPGVTAASTQVQTGIVYANPTVMLLASAIAMLVSPSSSDTSTSAVRAIEAMIDKYSVDMPTIAPEVSAAGRPGSVVVLLTGTTGGLGSEMLSTCLSSGLIQRVYALNRPSAKATPEDRHQSTFSDRGLNVELLTSPKLVYLEGDASKNWLGLEQKLYEEVRDNVTTIIHNAWRLDFNLSLASFEPNIRGIRNLLDLALTSPHAKYVRVLFTSSISVAGGWPQERGPLPEEPLSDPSFSAGQGYGEGKYVGERLLVKAAERGLHTTSFRIGQITGGYTNGAWATTDWVPILVKSSISLGCLPEAEGVVSWLPFETVCQAILDVAFSKTQPDPVLNLVHPQPTSWRSIFEHIANNIAKGPSGTERLPLVTWSEWYEKLQARVADATENDLSDIPAIKLADFFASLAAADKAVREAGMANAEAAGLTPLSTTKAQKASTALRKLSPLDQDIVAKWVSYWQIKGFLP